METSTLEIANKFQQDIKKHQQHAADVKRAIHHLTTKDNYDGNSEMVMRFESGQRDKICNLYSEFLIIQPKEFLQIYLNNVELKIASLEDEFNKL